MRSRTLFLAGLAAMVLLYFGYGLKRCSLGIDFTDEGAYLAWPLRGFFGERLFTADPLTLTRPIEAYLYLGFRLHPAMTLYEFRLAGWCLHLLAFGVLSVYLFRLSAAAGQSLLIASIPFFACTIYGNTSPSYNTLSCDCLLLALSLRGLSALSGPGGKLPWEITAGGALFLATLAHPALGLIAAVLLVHELLAHGLARNLARGRPTPSNAGLIVFGACWLAFLARFAASGELAAWWHRLELTRSFSATALHANQARFFFLLAAFPFAHSRLAAAASLVVLGTAGALGFFLRTRRAGAAGRTAALLAFLLVALILATCRVEPDRLPLCVAFISIVLLGLLGAAPPASLLPAGGQVRLLLLLSGLAAGLYASFTYYFTFLRTWTSGILGLPFALAVGLTLLFKAGQTRPGPFRLLGPAALLFAVLCLAGEHYRIIQRDAFPADLVAVSHVPRLEHIHSTAERMHALDELYDRLHPRLTPGEPLLAYDDCPMLYFLLEARPAYGLTWAVSHGLDPALLRQLDREFRAQPLPRYAIRTLVDVSHPVWADAPRTRYEQYPLNETVEANYELEQTIFPFEIWRLRPAGPREKTSPVPPAH